MSTNANSASYTAVIRWRGIDPTVELETRQNGFSSPEEAALYANALTPTSPLALRISNEGVPSLLLPDGRYVPFLPSNVTVWTLSSTVQEKDEILVADDADFQPHRLTDFSLAPSAHGDYAQAQYGVLDHEGWPVDVVVDWDEADHLRVRVEQSAERDDTDSQLAIGSLPEA